LQLWGGPNNNTPGLANKGPQGRGAQKGLLQW
jgi:hypothetical protein